MLRPLRRHFGRDKEYYRQIDDMFGFIPNNIELYKLALIHKSASFVLPDGSQMNNERLEYLGDAIIEAVTSDYLYIEFPDKTEGFLTQLRSKIVSRHSLNLLAERIGLDRFLVAHAGATLAQKHIYGDAFEAMIGAIYLDQGYDFTNRLLINYIYANFLDMDSLSEEETDFKSRLIEWCQKNHHTIRFVTKHTSPTQFLSTIFIDDMEVSHGHGTSKKESEQHAARTMAQTVSDSACLRMLDKLDKLDQQDSEALKPAPKARKTKPAQSATEQDGAPAEPKQTEPKPAKETKAPKASKPVKSDKSAKSEMPEKPENPEVTEPIEKSKSPVLEEPVKPESSEGVEEKPKVKRPRRTPKAKKSVEESKNEGSESNEEPVMLELPERIEPVAKEEKEAKEAKEEKTEKAEKPKRPRSRKSPRRSSKSVENSLEKGEDRGDQPNEQPEPQPAAAQPVREVPTPEKTE